MLYYILKVIISALLIVLVSEISKKYSLAGGIIASLPLISLMAIIWLYIDTKSIDKVTQLSASIFWMVFPSLSLFFVLPILLKNRIPFYGALIISCVIMALFYYLMFLFLKKLGISVSTF
ncbi:MAG TPA: DUF3147 family protein [candidate division Zixibacteria bacterium]